MKNFSKQKVLNTITHQGLIAIIRTSTPQEALVVAHTLANAGVKAIEISLTLKEGMEVIKTLSLFYKNTDVIIGAGTVCDPLTAYKAVTAGAEYIITPYLDKDTIKYCVKNHIPCFPGAMTVKEIKEAIDLGGDIIKVFPGELLGPKFIREIKTILPDAKLMPTGGVTPENITQWIEAGSIAVAVGNRLICGAKCMNENELKKLVESYTVCFSKNILF